MEKSIKVMMTMKKTLLRIVSIAESKQFSPILQSSSILEINPTYQQKLEIMNKTLLPYLSTV